MTRRLWGRITSDPTSEEEPGDPRAAIRMVNRFGVLRTQIGADEVALYITDDNEDRWLTINWDGTITTGRTTDEPQ